MAADSVEIKENLSDTEGLEQEVRGHGHFFTKKTFHKPTYCHHCTDMLWGLIGQGYVCEVCNFVVHDRCLKTVVSPCSSIATNLIKNPVAHCWSEPSHFKRKFCNVCRKRLEDSWAIRCEICEYYAHVDCQDFVVSDCKECATYIPNKDLVSVAHFHHWREGNLPGNSKCLLCKKTCWSAECLAGMRCEWCGVAAHAVCYKNLPPECNFGGLQSILLPPFCVTIPRTELPMETIIGVPTKKKEELTTGTGSEQLPSSKHALSLNPSFSPPARSISEEFSSSGDLKSKDADEAPLKEKDDGTETIKVFDGNSTLRRRVFRTISVPKNTSLQTILEAALRTFHITDDSKHYYVSEASDSSEKELDENNPIKTLKAAEGKRPAVFLRFKDKDPEKGFIKVYPGMLRLEVSLLYRNISVTSSSTVTDVILEALKKFGEEVADSENYHLIEVTLDKGVTERVMKPHEQPWQIMQQIRKESLRQMQMTRFYVQQKEDPHGPSVALFVGNLPSNISQRNYENILTNFLGKTNKFSYIGPIYYEYGSLVITYNCAQAAIKAFYTLGESTYEDKNLLVLLLPDLQPQMIPENVQPLLIFVNVKSGGCQGLELITSFRRLLNPYQVFDLDNGGPLPGLYVFRNVQNYKILVCGGDGTVGWVLQCLDNVGQDSECQSPPCAIVPLGTGNDLARVLRWGPGYTGGEDPLNLLRDVIEAEEIRLDRWTVVFHPDDKSSGDGDSKSINSSNPAASEDNTTMFVMNNYFGIGIDADLCLDFHTAREGNPDRFNSRLHNKGVYFKMGLRKMVNRKSCKDLHKELRLEVDGKPVPLPPVEGIIILNILSWGSGANPWGPEKEDQFQKPTHYDGMLEVVGVTGVVHMGQIQSGLRSAIRIAQGGHLRIWMTADLPVQVDGEPWIQNPGQVVVLKSALKATMLRKHKIKRRNTEPSYAGDKVPDV